MHYCLGANLAKREIQVMFEELVRRVGDIEILGDPVYTASGVVDAITCTIAHLPVRLTPRLKWDDSTARRTRTPSRISAS